jgi:hypothetical protein
MARALIRLSGPVWPLAPIAPATPAGALASCPLCGGDRTCPVDRGEIDDSQWWAQIRCGECGVWMEVVLSNAQAAALDVALDRQLAQIRRAADRLDRERMGEQVAAFISALRRDLIVAADF